MTTLEDVKELETNREEKEITLLNDALIKHLVASSKLKPLFLRIFAELSSFSLAELEQAHFSLGELPKKNKKQKKQVVDALFKIRKGQYLIVEFNRRNEPGQFEKNSAYTFRFQNKLRRTKKREPIVELLNIDGFNAYKLNEGIVRFKIRGIGHNTLKETKQEMYLSTHFVVDKNNKLTYNGNEDLICFSKAILAKNMKELKEVCLEGGEDWMKVYDETSNFIENNEFIEDYTLAEIYDQEINDAREYGLEEGRVEGREEGRAKERTALIQNMHKQGFSLEDVSKVIPLPKEQIQSIYYSV